MSDRPWYKRYGADFIAGTLGLSLEEKGAYSIILDLIYDRGQGIPDDARYIAGACGCSVRKWNSIRQRLIDLGKIIAEDGIISNSRAEKEIENAAKTARKLAENGRKGGEKSAEKRSEANENNDIGEAPLEHRAHKPEARGQRLDSPSEKNTPSGAQAPHIDFSNPTDAQVYAFGKFVLGRSAGGVITNLLKKCEGDLAYAAHWLSEAQHKETPMEWVQGVIRSAEMLPYRGVIGAPKPPVDFKTREEREHEARVKEYMRGVL